MSYRTLFEAINEKWKEYSWSFGFEAFLRFGSYVPRRPTFLAVWMTGLMNDLRTFLFEITARNCQNDDGTLVTRSIYVPKCLQNHVSVHAFKNKKSSVIIFFNLRDFIFDKLQSWFCPYSDFLIFWTELSHFWNVITRSK